MHPPDVFTDGPGGRRHAHEQLAALKQRLLDMSEHAEELVDVAVRALATRDRDAAELVISRDAALDSMEVEIEQRAISFLALQQPMGRDLRFIVSAIKISSDLERVGDHAVNIAEATLRLADVDEQLPTPAAIHEMARDARQMLDKSLDAFIRSDGGLGREVCRMDDDVDALATSVFRMLLSAMAEHPELIPPALQLLLVSRNLERVADLATNIAEDAVYLAEGKQIKHHAEST